MNNLTIDRGTHHLVGGLVADAHSHNAPLFDICKSIFITQLFPGRAIICRELYGVCFPSVHEVCTDVSGGKSNIKD